MALQTKHWQLPDFEMKEFKKKKCEYCVCIPILNEGEKFKKQIARMKKLTKVVDIIICDWGSTDGSTSPTFLRKSGVRTLLTKKSEGRQATQLRMGFAYAMKQGYKGVIQIDGNNKDGVDAMPNFVKTLGEGYDFIQGSRFIPGGKAVNTPPARWFGIRFIMSPLMSLATGYWYTDVTNGFRGFSRKYLLHPEVQPFRDVFVTYQLIFYLCIRAKQLGLKTKEIPVSRKYPLGKVPTKMNSVRSQFTYLMEGINTVLGQYHPKH